MEIPEILQNLERCRGAFPSLAVAEAIARREAITPELLRTLERLATNPEPFITDDGNFSHLFAIFLLAKFRETRAQPLVVRSSPRLESPCWSSSVTWPQRTSEAFWRLFLAATCCQ